MAGLGAACFRRFIKFVEGAGGIGADSEPLVIENDKPFAMEHSIVFNDEKCRFFFNSYDILGGLIKVIVVHFPMENTPFRESIHASSKSKVFFGVASGYSTDSLLLISAEFDDQSP